MSACSAIAVDGVLASQVIGYLDCQALTLGEQGYRELAAPASVVGVALPGLLALFVGFIGYRMMVGQTPNLRDGLSMLLRLGLALTLAGSWPAYRTLVYDVALSAPTQLADTVAAATQLPTAAGMLGRLDGVDRAIASLLNQAARPGATVDLTEGDARNLRSARTLFLSSAIVVFGFARMSAGVLLALGPLFAGLLLFDATRSLVEGWLRALIAALLSVYAGALLFGMQLGLLEPWLARMAAGPSRPELAGQAALILAVVSAFAVVLCGVIVLMVVVAVALRLPLERRRARPSEMWAQSLERLPSLSGQALLDRPRALGVVEALAAAERRESFHAHGAANGSASSGPKAGPGSVLAAHPSSATPAARRTAGRISGAARDRDTPR